MSSEAEQQKRLAGSRSRKGTVGEIPNGRDSGSSARLILLALCGEIQTKRLPATVGNGPLRDAKDPVCTPGQIGRGRVATEKRGPEIRRNDRMVWHGNTVGGHGSIAHGCREEGWNPPCGDAMADPVAPPRQAVGLAGRQSGRVSEQSASAESRRKVIGIGAKLGDKGPKGWRC